MQHPFIWKFLINSSPSLNPAPDSSCYSACNVRYEAPFCSFYSDIITNVLIININSMIFQRNTCTKFNGQITTAFQLIQQHCSRKAKQWQRKATPPNFKWHRHMCSSAYSENRYIVHHLKGKRTERSGILSLYFYLLGTVWKLQARYKYRKLWNSLSTPMLKAFWNSTPKAQIHEQQRTLHKPLFENIEISTSTRVTELLAGRYLQLFFSKDI